MEINKVPVTMEELKAATGRLERTLLKDIELQSYIRRLAKIIIVMLVAIIVFLVIRLFASTSEVNRTLQQIESLQKNIQLEHELIIMDREDVSKARTQVLELQRLVFKQDSLNKIK